MALGPQVEQFTRGSRIEGVPVMVAEASSALTKDQKPFTRYLLKDRSGTIPGIRWDHQADESELGALALVAGTVDEYRGQPQLKVTDLQVVDEPGNDLLARVTTSIPDSLRSFLRQTMAAARDDLPEVFWLIFSRALGHDPLDPEGDFWSFAAGQSKHHAEHGGLAWHVLTMYAEVDGFAAFYPKLDTDLLKLAVLCHDLGKLDCYVMGAAGARMLELDKTVGHTSYSMARVFAAIQDLRREGWTIDAADEQNLLHAIAAHHGRKDWGAVQEPASAEAAALHALDLLDSQLRGKTDPRTEPLPDRGGRPTDRPSTSLAAPAPEPEPDDEVDDPFLVDEDDPFDDDPPARPSQPTLF